MKSIFILFLVSIAIICNESIAEEGFDLQRSADGTYYMSGNPDLVGNYVDEQGNIIDDSGARLIGNIFKGPETTTPTFGGKKTKGYKGGKRGGKKGKGKAWKMGKSSQIPASSKSAKSKMPTSLPTRKKLFPLFPNLTRKPTSSPTKSPTRKKLFPFIFPNLTKKPTSSPTKSPTKKKLFPIFFPNLAEPANDRAFIFPTDGAMSNSLD